jgi:hypothetical protein
MERRATPAPARTATASYSYSYCVSEAEHSASSAGSTRVGLLVRLVVRNRLFQQKNHAGE